MYRLYIIDERRRVNDIIIICVCVSRNCNVVTIQLGISMNILFQFKNDI